MWSGTSPISCLPFEANGGRHGVSAALEFAVTQLNVPEIVTAGHESCGISAALTGRFHDAPAGEGGFIHRWMSQIDAPAKEIARIHGTGWMRNSCWKKRRSAKAWRTCELPICGGQEKRGELVVLGCHFSIRGGELWYCTRRKIPSAPVSTD